MPWLFFLLSPLATLTPAGCSPGLRRPNDFKRDFAWFFVAVVLASTSTASYTFVLLLLPVMLLLRREGPVGRVMVLVCYAIAAMPLRPAWVPFFPKFWVLLALYIFAGRNNFRRMPWKRISVSAVIVLAASVLIAHRAITGYEQEPGRRWERILTDRPLFFRPHRWCCAPESCIKRLAYGIMNCAICMIGVLSVLHSMAKRCFRRR